MTKRPNSMRRTLVVVTLILACASINARAENENSSAEKSSPQKELTGEFVYKYLSGEIAGQRGNVPLASSLFLDLAQSSRDARLAERATQAAAYANQHQLAIRAATLWTELAPDSIEALQALSQLLLASSSIEDAEPYLVKLLLDDKTRANTFMHLNGILARHPNKDAALALVGRLIQPYMDLPEARFTHAHSAWGAGQEDLAISELKAAEELRPGWELAAMLHGSILQKKPDSADIAFYHDFLQRYPDANDVRLALAKLLVNQNQFEDARTQFKHLADDNPDNPEMSVMIGVLAAQMEDYTQSDTYFKQALDHDFKHPSQLYIYLGQSAEKQEHDDQALDWYQRVEAGQWHFEAQLRIANLLARQGKLNEARELLQKLPDLSSEQQATALQVEANLLRLAEDYQGAYDLLNKAVSSLPNSPDIVYDFAMLAEKLQQFEIMEQQLRKLIQIKPDYAQAYNALGYSLADRNERLNEAHNLIEKALELSPDNYFILDSMGWVQYRMGKLDQALDYLRRAYAERPDPEIAAHLGEVLWHKGAREEAIKTWQDALSTYPDNEVLINTSNKFPQ